MNHFFSSVFAIFLITLSSTTEAKLNDFQLSKFKLSITYPNNEIKNFIVNNSNLKLDLKKSKWACVLSIEKPILIKDDRSIIQSSLICKKNSDVAISSVACVDGQDSISNANLQLVENSNSKNPMSHNILLSCDYRNNK